MSDEKLQFDDLDVKLGQSIDIMPKTSSNRAFYEAVVLGAIPNESLILGAPASGLFPKVNQGDKLVIRVKLADGLAIFVVNVLFISDVPMYMVYLDFPQTINFKRIRNATRVTVNLPVLASNLDNKKHTGITGRIIDISTTGAGLELSEYAGEKAESLSMKGKFTVGEIRRVLAIEGSIRVAKKNSETSFFYGIEFHEKDENDLLVLFGFIFNAMAFGKIQRIR